MFLDWAKSKLAACPTEPTRYFTRSAFRFLQPLTEGRHDLVAAGPLNSIQGYSLGDTLTCLQLSLVTMPDIRSFFGGKASERAFQSQERPKIMDAVCVIP